jgi:DNA-binding HxlR family transcriptional regulator
MSESQKFVLTDRDVRIFEYLFRGKGATKDQINRDVFGLRATSIVYRRLSKLLSQGLIERVALYKKGFQGVYCLTPKGLRFCHSFEGKRTRSELRSADFNHEIALVDIKHKLQLVEGCEYYLTENELQSGLYDEDDYEYSGFIKLNSDGFLKFNLGSKRYVSAIEYERSDKGKARYKRLFRDYYLRDEIPFVFYVLSSGALKKTILRLDKVARADKSPKIFCVELEELLKAKKVLSLENSDSKFLNLRLKKSVEHNE